MRHLLYPFLLSVLLVACSRYNGPVYPQAFTGNWVGVEKTIVGMPPILEVTAQPRFSTRGRAIPADGLPIITLRKTRFF